MVELHIRVPRQPAWPASHRSGGNCGKSAPGDGVIARCFRLMQQSPEHLVRLTLQADLAHSIFMALGLEFADPEVLA